MLTISKALSAGQAQSYHEKEFTEKEQSYWAQGNAVEGEWQGRLTEQYGLSGAVGSEEFARLSQGQHPQTGEQLVRHRTAPEYQDANGKTVKTVEHRAGWDATFSAPKSVSLTALVGRDDRVREAHRESVRIALDQLERYTQARRRWLRGGTAPNPCRHLQYDRAGKRAEPGLAGARLFQSQQFATAVYQAETNVSPDTNGI